VEVVTDGLEAQKHSRQNWDARDGIARSITRHISRSGEKQPILAEKKQPKNILWCTTCTGVFYEHYLYITLINLVYKRAEKQYPRPQSLGL
jgi:hypothetical protein